MRLNRLRQLTPAELRWRAGDAWRTAAERASARLRPSRWDRRRLLKVLSPDVLDAGLREAVEAQRWPDVHAALAAGIAARPSRYVLDPASTQDVRGAILAEWPGATTDAAIQADRMLDGRYDLLGYRDLTFRDASAGLDWHLDPVHQRRAPRAFWADVPYLDSAVGDHKVIWEFNRHQHWMRYGRAYWLTGDARYAAAIVTELESWLASNPPLVGINWASMLEAGLRSLSWVWALHCLLGGRDQGSGIRDQERAFDPKSLIPNPWLPDVLVGLDRHLTHIERHLSYYFSPNTHLTGEALALYVAGTALPELAGSQRWIDTGRHILLTEIGCQIHADGGHAERSTHYQRYTLDFYLLAYLTARHTGDTEAEQAFGDAALRLAEFTRTIADDSGRLPLIGDDDGGMVWPLAGRACSDVRDSLSLAAAVFDRGDLAPWGSTEEAIWIGGASAASGRLQAAPASRPESRLLAHTGYFVARDGQGGHAVLDVGRHGYMNAGHAHADALALTLTIAGRPLLIDPGTSTYTVNPSLRDRMRGSASHNTLTLDGRSQSIPAGPFHWRTQSHARLHAIDQDNGLDWILASHNGYGPDGHVRGLLRTPHDGWLIVDEIAGTGHHTAALSWHFDPAWQVSKHTPHALRAEHQDGTVIWLLHDGGDASLHYGDEESGLGWYAPVYGTLIRTWSARITRAAVAPFSMLTWIGSSETVPSLSRIDGADVDARAITARVDHDGRSTTFVIRPECTVEVRTGPAFAPVNDRELMCVSD